MTNPNNVRLSAVRGDEHAALWLAEIRSTNPDWPGADVRTAAAAILRASMPATLDGAA